MTQGLFRSNSSEYQRVNIVFSYFHNSLVCCLFDKCFNFTDLAKDLVVDNKTCGCVKSFCYLGNTLDGDGGSDLAATARIINAWMKLRELFRFLTSSAAALELKGWVYAVVSEAA